MTNMGAMEISENLTVPQNNDNPLELFKEELNNFNLNKESWANDLKQADKEAEKLRNEIRALRKQIDEQEKIIQNFKNKVNFRDNEINKLQLNKFVGDNNLKEIQLKYNSESIKMENEKLKAQIDILNEENHKLQQKEHFHSHRCREEEILNLEKIINNLQKENNRLQKNNNDTENKIKINKDKDNENYKKNINKLNNEINKLNIDINNLNNSKSVLEKENKNLKEKINILNKSLDKIEENKKTQKSEKDTEKLVLMRQVEDFKQSLIDVNNQNKELIASLKGMKDKNEKLSNEILKVRSNNLRIEDKINQNKYDILLADYNESIKSKENIEKKNLNLQQQLIILQNELSKVNDSNKYLNETVHIRDSSLKELNKVNSELNI